MKGIDKVNKVFFLPVFYTEYRVQNTSFRQFPRARLEGRISTYPGASPLPGAESWTKTSRLVVNQWDLKTIVFQAI